MTSPTLKFLRPPAFSQRLLRIAVIGVGGGEVLDALTRLHFGLLALGHPAGLHVTAFDADRVEPHNVGRQRFSQGDIGEYKALTLVHRINMFYGLGWDAVPRFFDPESDPFEFDLLIGCTDRAQFRVRLGESSIAHRDRCENRDPILWLDFGNDQHS